MFYSLLVIAVIPFSLSWMTYNPFVQTFLARLTASYLSERMNTVVKIDGLYITPRLDLDISGVLVLDHRNDTLFDAGNIFMDMKGFRLGKERKFFSVNDMSISDASCAIIKGRHDSVFSYSFIRDHFESEHKEIATDTIHGKTDWRVALSGLELENVRFRYINENKERKPVGMDYSNLDIFVHYLNLDDLRIHNDTFSFSVEKLKAYERCGLIVDSLQGDFRLSPLFLYVDNLRASTPNSSVNLDLSFKYDGWPSYLKFTEEVEMISDLRPSEINMKDIGYFAPSLLVMNNKLRMGGKVKGRVNNLRVKDLRFSYGRDTRFQGDVRFYGLPNVIETYIHTNIDEFVLTWSDIKRFAIPGKRRYIPVPEQLEVFGRMNIDGSFTGFYNDFVSTAEFSSEIGTITTDVSLRQNEDHTDVVYDGQVYARRFDIGKFLNLEDYIGEMDLNAMLHGSGLEGNTVEINMTGNIDSLEFMGNIFNQLGIRGEIADRKFNGHLKVQDELIDMVFNGILDFEQQKPLFDFTADIQNADLYRLNMLDRDSVSQLAVKLNCNFVGLELDDLEGRVILDKLEYREGGKKWFMEHLALISIKDTGDHNHVMLSSDIVDASVNGEFTFSELPYAIHNMIEQEFKHWSFMTADRPLTRRQSLSFDVHVKETAALTDIFVPELIVEPNSLISGSFDSETWITDVTASIPGINYAGIQSDSVKVSLISDKGDIGFAIETDRILMKEKDYEDTLQLGFENFILECTLDADSLKFGLGWDDQDHVRHNKAEIQGYYTYIDSLQSEMRITRSDVIINDSLWTISRENQVVFAPEYYNFHKLDFIGNKQQLSVNGTISRNPYDTLRIDFNNWSLSNFDIIFRNYNFDLNGVTDGYFGLSNLYFSPNFFSDLNIEMLEMNKVLIGDAHIKSEWDQENEAIDIFSEIIYHGNVSDSRVLALNGSYFPDRTAHNLDFDLEIQNFRLDVLEPFADRYISGLKGVSSGRFKIAGSREKPTLQGQLKLMRSECRIMYLNTRYSLGHTVDFKPGKISFNDLVVYDTLGNEAVANGIITHNNLRDFNFDISVQANDFICMQTNRYQNELFYGTGVVSGEVKFYGPIDDFHIDADVVSSKGSDITLPLNNSIITTENDFVVFLTDEEPEDGEMLPDYSVDLKGLSLDFNVEITNTAELLIFLPANMGNINSKGFGNIRFTVDPRGEFEIFGDYSFLRGTFFFTLQNLINRRFAILQGGKISFDGNPYNA
ncbi:MAG: translocation/assembly module TamB domain-containing protein, partial [Bacteroidota bacterium]